MGMTCLKLRNEIYFYNGRGWFHLLGKGLTSGALGALLEQLGDYPHPEI